METSFTQIMSRGCDADVTGGTQLVRCVMNTGLPFLKYDVGGGGVPLGFPLGVCA